jgi:hypothetical protein
MGLGDYRDTILAALRAGCRTALRDEKAAWRAIQSLLDDAGAAGQADKDQKERLDRYIYGLGLIYAHQTGSMPAFTNGETETRFERFVNAVPGPLGLRLTRNLVKAAIRRIDARRNPQFADDLANMNGQTAAE